jgi:hypothetical protein
MLCEKEGCFVLEQRRFPLISNTSPVYQKEFFVVQLAMAQKIAEIGHKTLEQVAWYSSTNR